MKAICQCVIKGKFKDGKPFVAAVFPAIYGDKPVKIFFAPEYFDSHPVEVGAVYNLWWSKEKKKFTGCYKSK